MVIISKQDYRPGSWIEEVAKSTQGGAPKLVEMLTPGVTFELYWILCQ